MQPGSVSSLADCRRTGGASPSCEKGQGHTQTVLLITNDVDDVLHNYTAIVRQVQRIRTGEHSFEINFLFTIWTRLLLADDAPAADAELMEPVAIQAKERNSVIHIQ